MGAAVALAGIEALGIALSPWLIVTYPLLLVVLSPSGRHLALAVHELPLWLLIVVATARRVLALAVIWLIGAVFGRAAIGWAETRFPRITRFIHWTEGLLRRFGVPLLVVAPGFTPSLMSGVTGIPFARYLPAITLGTAFYVALTVFFGEAVAGWTLPIMAWLGAHVVEATVVCTVVVGAWKLWSRLRRRPAGGLEG